MLTPKDLRNHEFQMSGRNGYLAADVDEYMDEVYSSYDQMFRENAEIVRKLQVLADRLAKYKDDEENIRNALVEAQRMKNSIIVEAQQKAQGQLSETEEKIRAARESVDAQSGEILDKARVEADEILKDARAEAAEIIERANKKATDLLDTANAIYEEKVGSVAEEAAKEEAYLEKVKVESAKIRKQLSDTYQMQMELLSFAPDFTSEVEHVEVPEEAEEAPVEETFVTGEEVLGERAYQETQERLEAEAATPAAEEPVVFPEPDPEPEVVETEPEEAPEEPAPAPADDDDDDGFGDIDKYLAGNSYEDINEGNKYFK
ncbi:MAG: DivIVA domain-containing protein [Clostridia bacterium]|nr:DivIVA domain-containing protein [Clostridia bacterium]